MNWDQLKSLVSQMCLAGIVLASWSLTQEVAGSSPFNDKYLGKTPFETFDTCNDRKSITMLVLSNVEFTKNLDSETKIFYVV